MDDAAPLMHVQWIRALQRLQDRVDEGVILFAEEIVGGQALTRVNDTNVTATLTGTPATALLKAVTITLGWTGTLGLARGGTASDLSATGGTAQYLKQSSVGAAITVGTIPASDIASPGALTRTNDTNVTLTLGGSPTVALLAATSLTLGWTGTLAATRGGTGFGSYAVGDLLYADTTTTLAKLADVSAGSYLRSGGVTTAPVWSTLKLPNAATTGDLVYASSANTLVVLGIGSATNVLTVSGGLPTWAAPAASATSVIVDDTTTNATMFPVWVTASSGSLPLKVSSTKLSFNPSTALLTVGPINAAGIVTVGQSGTSTKSFVLQLTNSGGSPYLYTRAVSGNAGFVMSASGVDTFFWNPDGQFQATSVSAGTITASTSLSLTGSASPTFIFNRSAATNLARMQFQTGGTTEWFAGMKDSTAAWILESSGSGAAGVVINALKGGQVGIGLSPTAWLTLKAGTTAASTAPLKFTSGALQTTAEAGAVEFLTDAFYGTITTGAARKTFAFLEAPALTTWSSSGKLTSYNGINTAGWGIPVIQASGRSAAQVAAVASVATYTLGAADGSFRVAGNVNVTTSTTYNFTVAVDYTDETNTAQTLTLTFSQLAGVFVTAITNVTGAGPYEGIPLQIRCKASTAITVKTVGVFTAVTYNVEGTIQQVS